MTIEELWDFCDEFEKKYGTDKSIEKHELTQRQIKTIEKKKPEHYLRVREVAKLVCEQYGINIGQNRLYDCLREWKMIIPNSTEPYQRAINEGYFVRLSKVVYTDYGTRIVSWTKVTDKGTAYILNRVRKEFAQN